MLSVPTTRPQADSGVAAVSHGICSFHFYFWLLVVLQAKYRELLIAIYIHKVRKVTIASAGNSH